MKSAEDPKEQIPQSTTTAEKTVDVQAKDINK
jgi:sec-independent protein translocase protein TatA